MGFYYQLLGDGFRIARTMTYDSDTVDIEAANARCGAFGGDGTFVSACEPPFPAGETVYGFVVQPGVGVEFWGPEFDLPFLSRVELGLRIAADLPVLANRDQVMVKTENGGDGRRGVRPMSCGRRAPRSNGHLLTRLVRPRRRYGAVRDRCWCGSLNDAPEYVKL